MWPTIQAAVKQVQAGVYTAQDFGSFSLMAKGGATLAPLHDWEKKLPADVMKLVEEKKQAILDGDLRVSVNETTPLSE
jgi:basic membrane lipoprotein Med (substrate-binding protein (PBP1-ABC) superfamily)